MNIFSESELFEALLNGENEIIEFKQVIPKRLEAIDRQVSAFANTKGGSIIFGVDDQSKDIVGVDEKRIGILKARYADSQYKGLCTVYTIPIHDKLVVVLNVERARTNIYVNGVAYVRKNDKVFSKVGDIRSKYLKEFIEEIQYHNRNPREIKVLELLKDISTNPEREIDPGVHLYRARIIFDLKEAEKGPDFWGYGKKESFVPPPEVTRDLRANYRYIPYLYCANDPYTALVEVRPRLGADVSMATIKVNERLTLLDFTLKKIPRRMTEAKFNLFSDLSMLFSKPVTSEDDILDYIPTQYVAEFAKHCGYDGIVFRSSLTPELDDFGMNGYLEQDRYNVVVFNYDKCEAIASNIVNVTRSYLECVQVDKAPNQMEILNTLIGARF